MRFLRKRLQQARHDCFRTGFIKTVASGYLRFFDLMGVSIVSI
jgi:hypothetical protein